jgi:ABC-type oligopeptide transport system ATPase subunit
MAAYLHQGETPLLEVRRLSLSFKDQEQVAVDRVSFNIRAGSTLGLVGASGAGKSSIARAVMKLIEVEAGEVLLDGEDILRMDSEQLMAARRRMQLVFQEPSASLSPRRTIGQTLLEPLQHFAIGDKHYQQQKIRSILHMVGLDHDVLRRYPHQFSSGQQQRIAIARALVTDPELLIADEAVSSLDVSIQAQILQLVLTLQKELGIAFLFISHDLAVIRQIADDIAVMYRGQLMEQSPADLFFSKPAHPYSKSLLSSSGLSSEQLAYTDADSLPGMPAVPWQIDRGSAAGGKSTSCVFSRNCPEKMPICEQNEPASQTLRYGNLSTFTPHCVKCHLYDEVSDHENP